MSSIHLALLTEDGLRFTVELRRFRPVVIDGSIRYAAIFGPLWQRKLVFIKGGKIGLDLTVDIPRPRRLGSVRLAELEAEVLQRVMRRGHSEQLIRRHG